MSLGRVGKILFVGMVVPALAWAQLKFAPATVDLGRQLQHQQLERTVTVTNTGRAPLEILRVLSDCGCTVATPAERHLAPGASTTLQLHAETRTFQGVIERSITLETTLGDFSLPVQMQVAAFAEWDVTPLPVMLPPSNKADDARATVRLTFAGNGGTKALDAKANVPWLTAKLTPGERAGDYLLQLQKSAAIAPTGNLSAVVTVTTSDATKPTLSIPVFVAVNSGVRVTPNPILLPTTTVGTEARGTFRVIGWTGQHPPVVRLAEGEVHSAREPNGDFTFEVRIRPERAGALTQMVQLYDGEQVEIQVPLVLRAEPAITAPAEKAPSR